MMVLLVIKIITLQLSHVSFEGRDVFLQDAPQSSNLQNITCKTEQLDVSIHSDDSSEMHSSIMCTHELR